MGARMIVSRLPHDCRGTAAAEVLCGSPPLKGERLPPHLATGADYRRSIAALRTAGMVAASLVALMVAGAVWPVVVAVARRR